MKPGFGGRFFKNLGRLLGFRGEVVPVLDTAAKGCLSFTAPKGELSFTGPKARLSYTAPSGTLSFRPTPCD